MCGLVGCFSDINLDKMWLKEASLSLKHRGPDDNGEWWSQDGKIGLAHRRLAILDLSKSGHQPMHLKANELSIVFNGEIYNHKDIRNELKKSGYNFTSSSDTEVLLVAYAHWGEKLLSKLNGMFAFAIYDNKKKKIFIARDRAGEKPIFFYHNNKAFYFSSVFLLTLT